jgi:hypothetical protein
LCPARVGDRGCRGLGALVAQQLLAAGRQPPMVSPS